MSLHRSDLRSRLLNSHLGETLGAELCEEVLGKSTTVVYRTNDLVFHEGDPAYAVFIVLEGVVKLVRYGEDGRETIIHLAEPVHMFAEAGVFLEHYPVTAVVSSPVTLLRIERETILELMEHHPVFLRRMFDTMAKWLQRLVDKIDQLTLNDATARLANYLLREREARQEESQDPDTIQIPVKKGELARMLNMNQATLSRALRVLQDNGTVQVKARSVSIEDVRALQQQALPPLEG